MPIILATRQEDHHKFKASLSYKMDTMSEKKNKIKKRERQTNRKIKTCLLDMEYNCSWGVTSAKTPLPQTAIPTQSVRLHLHGAYAPPSINFGASLNHAGSINQCKGRVRAQKVLFRKVFSRRHADTSLSEVV